MHSVAPLGTDGKASPRLSRRLLFPSAVAAVAAQAVPAEALPALPASPPPKVAPSDAALIAAAEEVGRTWAEEAAFDDLPIYALNSPESLANEARLLSIIERRYAAIEAAMQITAGTADGLRAKAVIIQQSLPAALELELSTEHRVIKLVMSLAEDLLAFSAMGENGKPAGDAP